jgi:beta-galactosidase
MERFDAGWRFFHGELPRPQIAAHWDQEPKRAGSETGAPVHGEAAGAENPEYNDTGWRSVDLPHDFSIEDLPPVSATQQPTLSVAAGAWKFQIGDDPGWKGSDYDDSAWPTVQLPTHWSTHAPGNLVNKFGWYRRQLLIPPAMRGKDVVLLLGKVDDVDETFVNGVKVGGMGSLPPAYATAWTATRRYLVPARLLNDDGTNLIAVRDYNGEGDAGIYEAAGPASRSGPFDSEAVGGASQGYTDGGVAWYRKSFPLATELQGQKISITFDGIYMKAQIWLNGHPLGDHPYGYTSFSYDLTPFIHFGSSNCLVVRVDSSGLNSRWYSGSGIYRHVWLTTTQPLHIGQWGVYVTTPQVDAGQATVRVRTTIDNDRAGDQSFTLKSQVLDPSGKTVATATASGNAQGATASDLDQQLGLAQPRLWSPDTPHLYRLVSTVLVDGQVVDQTQTPFGIRSIAFDAAQGFLLNGQPLKLRGGCVHHDNGPLGSCTYDRAEERRVELLKAAGFNAIRTSHNPPSPAFLDACDRLGMLVMDEAFDCWQEGKNSDDYHLYFADWWKRDLDSMIQRDRNHPSVILWSIGNEIPEQTKPEGATRAGLLASEVRFQDPTRPVTEATNPNRDLLDPLLEHLAVTGYNYEAGRFVEDEHKHPGRVFIQTESFPSSCLASWRIVQNNSFVVGDFVWTALDYIGEAGIGRDIYPGDNGDYAAAYPDNISGCGDLDLTGVRKPQSYYRGIVWGLGPKVAVFVDAVAAGDPGYRVSGWGWPDDRASWTWPGTEGKERKVRVYTNTPKVRLRLNGRDLGVKETTPATSDTATYAVRYEPGALVAEALDAEGRTVDRATLATTESASQIRLTPDRRVVVADGEDLAYVSVELLDVRKRLDPNASGLVHFTLTGPGRIIGVGNGDPISLESNQASQRHAFRGRCLVVIRSSTQPGKLKLAAESDGLRPAATAFESRPLNR